MPEHEKMDYVEFPAKDIEAVKHFFELAFGWTSEDYGPEYSAFSNEGLDRGFYKSPQSASTEKGSALIVFYSQAIDKTREKIIEAGGSIVKPIFTFPGGRRFHFCDPSDNEYAVWTDTNASLVAHGRRQRTLRLSET